MLEMLLEHRARVCFVEPEKEKYYFPRDYKSDEPLRLAIRNSHYDCARLLLEQGANVNARYFFGPEIALIHPRETEFLRLLLVFGADSNVYDRDGLTPLMRACKQGDDGLDTVKLLLEFGAYINATALTKQDLRTPLHYAVLSGSKKMVETLIQAGARVNMAIDYDKPSPLDVAVLRDKPCLVKLLLDAGANPDAVYTYIGSPLHLAACSELAHKSEIIEMLLKAGADPMLTPVFDEGACLKAPFVEYFRSNEQPHLETVRMFLSFGAEVIMRSPITDPRGMLRSLIRVYSHKDIWKLMLQAGHSYDTLAVERLTLPMRYRLQVIDACNKPPPLQQLARTRIRAMCNRISPAKVDRLPLPERMKRFLLYQ